MTAYRTKGTVSEDEAYALVQRYGASTIFTLLQEISQATEKDITLDWRTLVKATSTGISNAQEYQMLWRHLAYRDTLERVEDGGEPLSDESDLEFELEATPNPIEEISAEVDCCVKVILSSGSVGDCSPAVALNAEVPPATDTAHDQASATPSDKQHFGRYNRATNGAAPPKQPLSAGPSNEGLDGNGSSNSFFPAKKKRKLWTKEEDLELMAAVKKFGEGNWANILKGDFKHDRTAAQLSQRWAIIRKRQLTSKQSNVSKERSEEMLAAQKAFSMALNMPMSRSLSTILPAGSAQIQTANSSTSMAGGTPVAVDESQPSSSQASKQIQQPTNQETFSHKLSPTPSNKPRITLKKPPSAQPKPSICPNPLIKAAAFAAGGRIATPSTAASLFKAAQSKHVVRIRHTSGASVASTISSPSTVASSSPTATTTTSHALNPRFIHPSVSLISSGSGLITSKLCQVQSGSGKASSLPSNTSSLSSELRLGVMASCGPHANGKRRRSVASSAIDADELLAEEGRVEPDNEASDKLVQATENGSSVDGREMSDNQCIETEQIQSNNLKEGQLREAGGSKLDEEVILMAKGRSGDEGVS